MKLTARQKEVFDFIQNHIEKNGISPSIPEIAKYFGFSAKSTAHEYLQILEEKGYIAREAFAHNSIEVLDTQIALLGRVAAGRPID